jgi:hypothetical protein
MKLFLTCLNFSRFIFLQNRFGQLFWPFLTSKNKRQIAVRERLRLFKLLIIGERWRIVASHYERLRTANSHSRAIATICNGSQPFATIRNDSSMINNLKKHHLYLYSTAVKNFIEKFVRATFSGKGPYIAQR